MLVPVVLPRICMRCRSLCHEHVSSCPQMRWHPKPCRFTSNVTCVCLPQTSPGPCRNHFRVSFSYLLLDRATSSHLIVSTWSVFQRRTYPCTRRGMPGPSRCALPEGRRVVGGTRTCFSCSPVPLLQLVPDASWPRGCSQDIAAGSQEKAAGNVGNQIDGNVAGPT